jgi:required for meiotic nuclear division protein 1
LSESETPLRARAWFVGRRIDVRQLESFDRVAQNPLVVRVGEGGYAVVFRFGALCLVGVDPETETRFLETMKPLVQGRLDDPESETCDIVVRPGHPERVDPDGRLNLQKQSVGRIQAVADATAKSAVLSYHERRVALVFDRVEGLALELRGGARHKGRRDWLKEIGEVLLTESQMVGRVEVTEKPEFTWEDPALDRLYERLAIEFELRERDRALSRKLELISRSAETYLNLVHNRQSLRVEWYIVVLIVIEIALGLFQTLVARGS